ncbi:MAG TPA: aminotransferase class III-fold pyridoxal phosphate-dependent enzyme, partial [Candidatus Limnocylindrales bacterium]
MAMSTNAGSIHPAVGEPHLRLASGSGCRVRDEHGRAYLDAVAGVGVMSLGYGRDDIVAAAAAQARQLPFSHSMRFANEASDVLAARLRELTPDGIDWFFFCSGGSEALDSAVKIIRHYWLDRGQPSRWRIIARRPSFHGNTLAGLSVGYHAARRTPFLPYLWDMPHIPAPWRLHCPNHGEGAPDCAACTGTALQEAIEEVGPDSVAAFIAEPLVGAAAPAVTPDPGYYETIRAICDRYDVLFVADEVMT